MDCSELLQLVHTILSRDSLAHLACQPDVLVGMAERILREIGKRKPEARDIPAWKAIADNLRVQIKELTAERDSIRAEFLRREEMWKGRLAEANLPKPAPRKPTPPPKTPARKPRKKG